MCVSHFLDVYSQSRNIGNLGLTFAIFHRQLDPSFYSQSDKGISLSWMKRITELTSNVI